MNPVAAKSLYDRLSEVERELTSGTSKDINARYRALNKLRVVMDDLRDAMQSSEAA